ncbi:hypothetical protein DL764_001769 [Monosporascus ibericus]|uniref:Cullin N-terminal domain-containing protein n=1 Tax=Monosporascus ibericus TaxID=155417 RepID=A0A4Q4TN48_9PEZI|nr:hypothetical protein DL764_001769 [Monosporascus ibericus]
MGFIEERVPGETLDVDAYMRGYNAVFECLTAGSAVNRYVEGKKLYDRLESYLKGAATAVYDEARDLPDGTVVGFYNERWDRWNHAAKRNRSILRYFERHWITRETAQPKEGANRSDVCEIVDLHMKLWVSTVFEPLEGRLNRAGEEHGIRAKGIDGGTSSTNSTYTPATMDVELFLYDGLTIKKVAFTTDLVHIDIWITYTSQSNNIGDPTAPGPYSPLVRYGHDVMHIPGDRYGKTFKYAGNIPYMRGSFPRFTEADLVLQDEETANPLAKFLKGIKASFLGGEFDGPINVVMLHDNTSEKTVEFETDAEIRALEAKAKSTAKMKAVELPMGKDIQSYLMAKRILLRDTPSRLFGTALMEKVTPAAKQWTGILPLARRSTARHSGNEFILRSHPELNIELGIAPKELEERSTCIVHYEMGAEQGHQNPKVVYRTQRCRSREAHPRLRWLTPPSMCFPISNLASSATRPRWPRFLMRHPAPEEYEICIEAFSALPTHNENGRIVPHWVTLFVFGVNSFTERHRDRQGFTSLVPLPVSDDLSSPGLITDNYKPEGCAVLRGAELEHLVEDWHGSRMFLLCTNDQAVRNLADCRARKLPSLPSEPWHRPCRPEGPGAEGGISAAADVEADDDAGLSSDEDENEDDPYVIEEIDVEKPPEGG